MELEYYNISKELRYSGIHEQKENEFIIINQLEEYINSQFNFENIGYNYYNDYDEVPLEIHSWFLEKVNELYFDIPEIEDIYDDTDRIILMSTTIYNFLFVDILNHIEQLDVSKDVKQLLIINNKAIIDLKNLINTFQLKNEELNKKYIQLSIISECLNQNLDKFNDNYFLGIKNVIKEMYI